MMRHTSNGSVTLSYRKCSHSLLWLHGLADHSSSYLPFFGHLNSPLYHHTRVTMLQAPTRNVSLNAQSSPAWFDVKAHHRSTLL